MNVNSNMMSSYKVNRSGFIITAAITIGVIGIILGGISLKTSEKKQAKQTEQAKQTYFDRTISTYENIASGISYRVVFNRDNMSFIVYSRFDFRNKTQWEKQYSGTYIEDKSESNDYQVICYLKIEEDEHRSLGDFLKAEININTDEVLMIAPANECICYHVDN